MCVVMVVEASVQGGLSPQTQKPIKHPPASSGEGGAAPVAELAFNSEYAALATAKADCGPVRNAADSVAGGCRGCRSEREKSVVGRVYDHSFGVAALRCCRATMSAGLPAGDQLAQVGCVEAGGAPRI